ncbi:MAG: 5-formyltetrahydrofolate cyclo-ligase [Clostridiales bacterium]|nr:5-formyltetrahydrofolate cyclo-ligase [Clostridiales bacterium]
MADLITRKREARAELIAARDALDPAVRRELDGRIIERFTDLVTYRYAGLLLLYCPNGSEIDVLPLEEAALRDGKRVAYPRCGKNRTMTFFEVGSHAELEAGSFGLREPGEGAKAVDPSDLSSAAVIIPALCWDEGFRRIGYGGGYYDRWLPGFPGSRVGFCYSSFMRRSLPVGRFDCVCDVIVTEKGVKTRDV